MIEVIICLGAFVGLVCMGACCGNSSVNHSVEYIEYRRINKKDPPSTMNTLDSWSRYL